METIQSIPPLCVYGLYNIKWEINKNIDKKTNKKYYSDDIVEYEYRSKIEVSLTAAELCTDNIRSEKTHVKNHFCAIFK